MSQVTAADLITRLGIHPSLLYLWERMLGLPGRYASLLKRRYDDRLVQLFEVVHNRRRDGHAYADIAAELGPLVQGSGIPGATRIHNHHIQEKPMTENEQRLVFAAEYEPTEQGDSPVGRRFSVPMRTAPIELVEHLNDLQELYTKAVYLIGQLEERLKVRDRRVAELEQAVAAPERQFRELLLLQELKDAQKYIGMLEAELTNGKARPRTNFFSRLFSWRPAVAVIR